MSDLNTKEQLKSALATGSRFATVVTISLALVILAGGLKLLLPFFEPICWAIILALFFYPAYERLLPLLRGAAPAASLIMCILIITFIIIPVFALLASLTAEVIRVYDAVMTSIQAGSFTLIPDPDRYPLLNRAVSSIIEILHSNQVDVKAAIMDISKGVGEYMLKQGTVVFKNATSIIFKAALMLVILYYLFTDGMDMLNAFKRLLPMREQAVEDFMTLTSEVLSATLYGNLLTGAIQAGLGIFIFWALDFSAALLWGILLGLGTFIPMIGTAIVWAPATIYLFLAGDYVKGAILLTFSILVISQIDYFLRPYLISGKTELHNLFLFLGILGGLNTFGLLGLILGPIIIALCMSILELYASDFLHKARQ